MAVTIVDVAQQAGVSPSTVSRVISNDVRISQKTVRKVRKVME
ncbi:LacI family DNA-binding transcriptional regulator, partial [Clostridium perfringens]|nr:LacI family DNA-binding transcriptional regulator [Clostridium perfringens]